MDFLGNLSDAALTDLLKSGNRMAFRELYNRYWKLLLDAAYKRLSSTEEAEELVQDLFVSLFIRRESLVIKTSLESYLKTALKYKVFDVFRSRYVHNKYVDSMANGYSISTVTPEQVLEEKELSRRINSATEKMPDKCREVFLMSRMENLSNKSIAERLNISVSTVEKHISKAKRLLETDFREYHLEVAILLLYLLKK